MGTPKALLPFDGVSLIHKLVKQTLTVLFGWQPPVRFILTQGVLIILTTPSPNDRDRWPPFCRHCNKHTGKVKPEFMSWPATPSCTPK